VCFHVLCGLAEAECCSC